GCRALRPALRARPLRSCVRLQLLGRRERFQLFDAVARDESLKTLPRAATQFQILAHQPLDVELEFLSRNLFVQLAAERVAVAQMSAEVHAIGFYFPFGRVEKVADETYVADLIVRATVRAARHADAERRGEVRQRALKMLYQLGGTVLRLRQRQLAEFFS